MNFLNGWKTILGVVLLAVVCIVNGGNILACVRDVLATPAGQAGMAAGLTAVGLTHKVEKFLGRRTTGR